MLDAASRASTAAFEAQRERWFERLLGPEREDVPSSSHMPYVRRLSPLEGDVHEERAVQVCVETLAGSASTSRASRGSGSTSTTGRRSRRGRA